MNAILAATSKKIVVQHLRRQLIDISPGKPRAGDPCMRCKHNASCTSARFFGSPLQSKEKTNFNNRVSQLLYRKGGAHLLALGQLRLRAVKVVLHKQAAHKLGDGVAAGRE